MPKIRFTKNELKRQKDNLKMFMRYLPMLQLKKQQLQIEILKLYKKMEDLQLEIQTFKDALNTWIDVFSEDVGIKDLITISKIDISTGNIAGVDIPVLNKIEFGEKEYDLMAMPIWVDYGIIAMKKYITLKINYRILEKQLDAIKEELRITTQRVNLFEKVKIPQAEENIRRIQIYLGDMQTNAVVIGKIAKDKIERKQEVFTP